MNKKSMLIKLSVLLSFLMLFSSCSSISKVIGMNISKNEFQKSGDNYFLDAIDAYDDYDYEKTIELCNLAIEAGISEYDLDDVYKFLGVSYSELEEYEKAIEAYESGLEFNENNVMILTNMGVTYRLSGDYDKAIELYEKAISIDPKYAEAYSSLGSVNVLMGNSREAIEYFLKAVEIDPSLAVAYGNLALAYAMEGEFEEAEKTLKIAIAKGYTNGDTIKERIDSLKKTA